MKSYTDLEQSKKLAEILSIESSDMEYLSIKEINTLVGAVPFVKDDSEIEDLAYSHTYNRIPCWSLAALLDIIPYAIHKSDNEFYRLEIDKGYNDYAIWYSNNGLTINNLDVTSDNFIDACVAMIEKLHEQKLL